MIVSSHLRTGVILNPIRICALLGMGVAILLYLIGWQTGAAGPKDAGSDLLIYLGVGVWVGTLVGVVGICAQTLPRKWHRPLWGAVPLMILGWGLLTSSACQFWNRAGRSHPLVDVGARVTYESIAPGWLRSIAGSRVDRLSLFQRITKVEAARPIGIACGPGGCRTTYSYASLKDHDLTHLKGLVSLTELDLRGMKVTGAGLMQLGDLTGLQRLVLARTQIDDEGLTHLQRFPYLVHLNLSGTGVSDFGLKHLTKLKKLKELELHNTNVSPNGLSNLRLALPGTKVSCN